MKGDTIEHLRDVLEGRRVLSVTARDYGWGHPSDFPVLALDDGSEVVLLDGNGFPPISEQEKPPWAEPLTWEGDNA